jgi:hypothetical protein
MYMPPKRSRPSTPSSPGAAGGRARLATPTPPVTPERQSPVYGSFGASMPSRPTRPVRTTQAAPTQFQPVGVPIASPQVTPGGTPEPVAARTPPRTPTPTMGGSQGFKLKQPQYSMPKEGAGSGSYFRDRGINFGPRKKKTLAQQQAFLLNFQRALRRARK